MKRMRNASHIEGLLYQHNLELKRSGENSKTPGTEYITGTVEIATDNLVTNIVPVHFTYVTATTAKGTPNATYTYLKNMIDKVYKTCIEDGQDQAAKLKIDSAIGLNEFYSDRNGTEELVSVKRNEGGFIHTVSTLEGNEALRNTFDVDILITNVRHVDANEETGMEEKAIIKGAIFDFRNSLLPVEFSVTNPKAMAYFEDLGATERNPFFTEIRGSQISESIVNTVVEESAFGEPSVREYKSTRKDFVVTWAKSEPYEWDSEETITAAKLTELIANREVALAELKKRSDDYKASKGTAPATAAPASGGFNF